VKKDGEWYFESVRDSVPHPPSNAEHFEDLEWLLGEWTGEAEKGESAKASYAWAENLVPALTPMPALLLMFSAAWTASEPSCPTRWLAA